MRHKMAKVFSVTISLALMIYAFTVDYLPLDSGIAEQEYEKVFSFIPTVSKFFLAIGNNILDYIPIVIFIIFLYKYMYCKKSRNCAAGIGVLAVLASANLMLGNIFRNNLAPAETYVRGVAQVIKLIMIFVGYTIFFYKVFLLSITVKTEKPLANRKETKEIPMPYAYAVPFIILLIGWIPIVWAYYPAMFMGDTEDILYMAFNYKTTLADSVLKLSENVNITNHHPVIYTWAIGGIFRIVRLMGGSDNIGACVCACIQYVITAAIISYSCIYCTRELHNSLYAVIILIFAICCPWIPKYTIMLSKDTIFADAIIYFSIKLHCVLRHQKKKDFALLVLAALIIVLFRKNGIYIVLPMFAILCFVYRDNLRKWIVCIGIILLFQICWNNILLPACGISQGSIREALSIPFQQTARYVKMYEEEVTQEEKEAIDRVLEYDLLAELYDAERSDNVKATYRKNASSEAVVNYLFVWGKMLFKHPGTYILATFNNYYGYFYPVVNNIHNVQKASLGSMQNTNRDGYFQFSNKYDEMHVWARDVITFYDMCWMRIPILNLLATSAFYVWMVLWGVVYHVNRRDKETILFMLVYLLLILTTLMGPCNGIDYERYIYPCILGFPVIICMMNGQKGEEAERSISRIWIKLGLRKSKWKNTEI